MYLYEHAYFIDVRWRSVVRRGAEIFRAARATSKGERFKNNAGAQLQVHTMGRSGVWVFSAQYGEKRLALVNYRQEALWRMGGALRWHRSTLYDCTLATMLTINSLADTKRTMEAARHCDFHSAQRAVAALRGTDHEMNLRPSDFGAPIPTLPTLSAIYVAEFAYREPQLAQKFWAVLRHAKQISLDHMFPSKFLALLTVCDEFGRAVPFFMPDKSASSIAKLAEDLGKLCPTGTTVCPQLQHFYTDCDCCSGSTAVGDVECEVNDVHQLAQQFAKELAPPVRETALSRALSQLAGGKKIEGYLDLFHLIKRTVDMVPAHPWRGDFSKELSRALVTFDAGDYDNVKQYLRAIDTPPQGYHIALQTHVRDHVLRCLREPEQRERLWAEVAIKFYSEPHPEAGALLSGHLVRKVLSQLVHVRYCLKQGPVRSVESSKAFTREDGTVTKLTHYYYMQGTSMCEMVHGSARADNHAGSLAVSSTRLIHAATSDVYAQYNHGREKTLKLCPALFPLSPAELVATSDATAVLNAPKHLFGARNIDFADAPDADGLANFGDNSYKDFEAGLVSTFVAERAEDFRLKDSLRSPPPGSNAHRIRTCTASWKSWPPEFKARVDQILNESEPSTAEPTMAGGTGRNQQARRGESELGRAPLRDANPFQRLKTNPGALLTACF